MQRNMLLAAVCLVATPALADSYLTSTSFSDAYDDIPEVARAHVNGLLSEADSKLISDKKTPLGVKLALVNAFYIGGSGSDFWDDVTDSNYEIFAQYLKKKYRTLSSRKISGDELACLGYLYAMENYKAPNKALRHLKAAQKKNKKSLATQITTGLVIGQDSPEKGDAIIKKALANKKLVFDIRPEALEVMFSYVKLAWEPDLDGRKTSFLDKREIVQPDPPGDPDLLERIHSFSDVRDWCKPIREDNGDRNLSFCLEVRPGLNYQRDFYFTLRDASRGNVVNNHVLLKRFSMENAIQPTETVLASEYNLDELKPRYFLVWIPILKGTSDQYEEAYSLAYFFDLDNKTVSKVDVDMTCPKKCTSQFLNYQTRHDLGWTHVWYTTTVNDEKRKATYSFDGTTLVPN